MRVRARSRTRSVIRLPFFFVSFRIMLNDWKQAWREAVENFKRELGEEEEGPAQTRAMRREFHAARAALERLLSEIARVRTEAAAQREQESICRRREGFAHNIGDAETVRLAAQYALKHAELASVLERKVEVLEAEHTLLARDLATMEAVLGSLPAVDGTAGPTEREVLEERQKQDRDFGRLEREARERAAAEKLEELKRRMR
jgi:hypothetical protein